MKTTAPGVSPLYHLWPDLVFGHSSLPEIARFGPHTTMPQANHLKPGALVAGVVVAALVTHTFLVKPVGTFFGPGSGSGSVAGWYAHSSEGPPRILSGVGHPLWSNGKPAESDRTGGGVQHLPIALNAS